MKWRKWCVGLALAGVLAGCAPAVQAQSVAAEQGYKRARTMASNQRWDDAIATINEVLKKAPNYPDALYLAGVCHLSKGDYQAAEKRLKRLTELNKEFINGWGMLANCYLATKQYDKIRNIVSSLGKVKGGKAEAYYFSGIVAYMNGNLDQAERDWRNAVRAVPDMAKAHYNIGGVMYAKGDKARAMQGLKDALRFDPENPLYRYSVADLQLETGNKIEGMKNLDRVRQQTLRKDVAKLASARQMWANNHAEQTEKLAKQAYDENPDFSEAYLLRAKALDKLGRKEEAIKCYRRALEGDPNYREASQALARLAPAKKAAPQQAAPKVVAPADDDSYGPFIEEPATSVDSSDDTPSYMNLPGSQDAGGQAPASSVPDMQL